MIDVRYWMVLGFVDDNPYIDDFLLPICYIAGHRAVKQGLLKTPVGFALKGALTVDL